MLPALAAALVLLADPGSELNTQGENLCKQGQFREALALFRRAADVNPRLASAFYNEALALAALRRTPTVRLHPSKKDVLDAAEAAIQLDPKIRDRAENELPAVRTTFRGQRLLGRTPEKDAPAILQAIAWRSRNGERLDFSKDGTLSYRRDLLPRSAGRWSVDGQRVTLTFGSRRIEASLDSDGVLTLGGLGHFFDW